MATVKTAKVILEMISILCPNCNEFQANRRDGAQHFTDEDAEELRGGHVTCEHCGVRLRLPAIVNKL